MDNEQRKGSNSEAAEVLRQLSAESKPRMSKPAPAQSNSERRQNYDRVPQSSSGMGPLLIGLGILLSVIAVGVVFFLIFGSQSLNSTLQETTVVLLGVLVVLFALTALVVPGCLLVLGEHNRNK